MIVGFFLAAVTILCLSLTVAVFSQIRATGSLTEDSNPSGSSFALVFMGGMTVLFAVMTYMRFSGTL